MAGVDRADTSYVLIAASPDDRNGLTDALTKAGFVWIESSGTRAVFEDGDYMRFLKVAKRWARTTELNLTRVLRIEDPGLGVCLGFPEDGTMSQHDLHISDTWASI